MSTSSEVMQFILAARDNASATVKKVGGELNQLGPTAGKAAGPLNQLATVTGGLVSPATLAVGAVAAFTTAAAASVQAASDLNEEIDKSKVVFGPAAATVQAFADSASSIGLSERAALGAAGAFGNMFNTVGLGQGAAADMSTTMVKLAADMASFNNEDPSEMLDRLRSGLSGEAEPLRRFGVLLSEAAVKEFAYREGIAATGEALTEAQKVQARYGLIMEQTAIQQGNFALTSGSLANLQRTLGASIENLGATFGQALLPIVQQIVSFLVADVMPTLSKLAEAVGPVIDVLLFLGSVALKPTTIALGLLVDAISIVVNALTGPFTAAWTFAQQVVGNVASTIIGVAKNIVGIAASIPGPWQDAAGDMRAALEEAQASVDSWGEQTQTSTAEAGAAVSNYTAQATGTMAAATPTIQAEAAAQGAAIASGMREGTAEAVEEIKLLPGELAQALVAGQTEWQDAWDTYKQVMDDDLTESQEIARLRARLTSRELVRGLDSTDPERRAAAQAMADSIKDRLFALQQDVPQLARKTGVSYADALETQRALVRAVGSDMAEDLRKKLELNLTQGGKNSALSWIEGLRAQEIVAQARRAALDLANFVSGPLEGQSPPKEGPLRHIDRWGRNVANAWLAGFQQAGIGDVVGGLLAAPGAGAVAGRPRGGGAARDRALPPIQIVFQSQLPPTPGQEAELARRLGPELSRWLRQNG